MGRRGQRVFVHFSRQLGEIRLAVRALTLACSLARRGCTCGTDCRRKEQGRWVYQTFLAKAAWRASRVVQRAGHHFTWGIGPVCRPGRAGYGCYQPAVAKLRRCR